MNIYLESLTAQLTLDPFVFYTVFMTKIRVGVMRGGIGSGYHMSLLTGGSVLMHLPEDAYDPIDILITKDGDAHIDGVPVGVTDLARKVDVVFNALVGEYGEDGQIQWLLNRAGIQYTGSDVAASALAAHKTNARLQARRLGLKTPAHYVATNREGESVQSLARDIFQTVPQPSIIKPLSGGCSIGVSVAGTFPALLEAVEIALQESDTILAEEFIFGKEVTCGVIDGFRGQEHYVLPPVEICLSKDEQFFDYDMKYGGVEGVCPARLKKHEREAVIEASRKIHQALGLRHYSRSDFIVSPRGVYFLEVNPMPGLGEGMPFSQSLSAVGSSLPELLDHVVERTLRG